MAGTETAPALPARTRVLRIVVWPLAHLLLTASLAAVVSLGLELVHAAAMEVDPLTERFEQVPGGVLWLAGLVVWPIVVLIHAVTTRAWLTASISLALATFVGFANYQKMALRGEPVYPTDLTFLTHLGFLVDNVGIVPAVALLAVLVGVPLIAWRLVRIVRLRRPRPQSVARLLDRRLTWVLRGAAAGAASGALIAVGGFNDPGNKVYQAFVDAGISWAAWEQPENYRLNGFIAGTLYNLPAPAMETPDGYSREAMHALAAKYGQAALATNAGRDAGALEDTNVVVILGETFSDPLKVQGLAYGEDPMRYTRELMQTTTSGSMLSNAYGGGTANVEFEVLTGLALRNFEAQVGVPYQNVVPHHSTFPSFVPFLAGEERTPIAIHPFLSSFYRRDAVYPAFGFERATFADEMENQGRHQDEPFISDKAAYAEVVDELRASEEPMFVNLVTMQNHRPVTDRYSNPVSVQGPLDEWQTMLLGQYLRAVRYSDRAIESLVEDLEDFDERTIVLFYGDHLAAEWPEHVLAANEPAVRWTTPYFVWANFPTQTIHRDTPLGSTFLVNELLATANAPVSPLNALLAELSEELPSVATTLMLDADGVTVTEDELGPRAKELLQDYRLVQYDLTVGERYVVDEMLTVPGAGGR